MRKQRYASGEPILREGEESDSVCRIIDGRVKVIKERGAEVVVLGHIGPGEYVGEMGAIQGRPRCATVCAENEVTVEWIEKAEFLKLVSENSETALGLFSRLSERLASLNGVYSESVFSDLPVSRTSQVSKPVAAGSVLSKVTIYGHAPELKDFLPSEGLVIDAYPYVVGRLLKKGDSTPEMDVNLTVKDSKPYRMSRAHFAVLQTQDGFQVRDLDSTLGTSVNGVFLGTHFGTDLTSLKQGENIVAAGGVDTKFKFRLVCL
jgi:hypothetical protein